MEKQKTLLILFFSTLLVGCSTMSTPVVVKTTLPTVTPELLNSCEPLSTVDSTTTSIQLLMSTVAANYSKYHRCATLQKNWIEWYRRNELLLKATQ